MDLKVTITALAIRYIEILTKGKRFFVHIQMYNSNNNYWLIKTYNQRLPGHEVVNQIRNATRP